VPSLHTLYIDKPMKDHGLMQAIARVNRVYKDKEGGLIVDYLGIAQELKKAVSNYTKSGGKGKPTFDQSQAVALMMEKYEIVKQFFHRFDYSRFFSGTAKEKMQIIPEAMEHILSQDDGKKRYVREVIGLTKAYALAVPSKEAEKIRDNVGFFQAIKASIVKNTETQGKEKSDTELHSAIKQIVSKAVASEGVIDVFEQAGMKKPEISVLSDHFLEDVKGMKHKNLAFEALKKLLADQIRVRFKHNKIRNKKFSEMLEEAIRRYQNRSIDSAQVIQELIELAKQIRDDKSRGKELGLSEEEEAFYDALDDNDGARDTLGDDVLKIMARELSELVRKNASIDWTLRETVQANLRRMVKRLLRKYGYPPDKQQMATDLVLKQAELFADDWSS
ncbi:DEAD/DEAH box helicase, partial [Candidatus Woesearchaeota archaeon CG10_big_fil_rev_8_21_14_0_10_34_8]